MTSHQTEVEMTKGEQAFHKWYSAIDDDEFQGWIDGQDPHELAEEFALRGYVAATARAVEAFSPVLEGRVCCCGTGNECDVCILLRDFRAAIKAIGGGDE